MEMLTQIGEAEPIHVEVPMHVVRLPASLGLDRYVWALVAADRSAPRGVINGFVDSGDEGRGVYVVGYDRNGDLIPG